VWDDFCDWYVEASKERLRAQDVACGATLLAVLKTIVRLLQPFAPYLAEELAQALGEKGSAAHLAWPGAGARDGDAEARMGRIQDVIRAVRKIRNENRVPDRAEVAAGVSTADPAPLLAQRGLIRRLAKIDAFDAGPDLSRPSSCAVEVLAGDEVMAIFTSLNDAGQTIVLVTHEHDIAEHAKRQIFLRDGVVERDVLTEHRRIPHGSGPPRQ
jgi:valyl-tRNA synthetase